MIESFFIFAGKFYSNFNGKFYEQLNGVAIDLSLGFALANVNICQFENIRLENCPIQFKPIASRRFVDVAFLLF